MLLKWQAIILNNLYQTTIFDKIVIKSAAIEEIDYTLSFELYKHISHNQQIPSPQVQINEFVSYAHLLCKSKDLDEKRQKIIWFDRVAADMNQGRLSQGHERGDKMHFGIYHVILFSCLSKCTIWPSMFKTSKALVPALIQFYNRFFNSFSKYLDYKFDPLILSNKYSKLVKQIKEKKLAHPELFQAVEENNIARIRDIVGEGQGSMINECMRNGLNISHVAAMHSSVATLRALLYMKANFQLLDEQKQTALFYAVKRFDLEVIIFLVEEAKVNINHTEYQNRTPIYLAAFEGKLEIVQYLYQHGANPQIQSKLARTPLSKACYLGNVTVAEYLIKLGVNTQSIDSKGRTALHNAAWGRAGGKEGKRRGHIQLEDSPECVQLLIKAGHKIDFQDFDKFTPLFSSISSDAERSLRVLVKYGANLKHKTIKGQSCTFIACKYGHPRILKILVQQFECEYQDQTIQGYTPIMAALAQQQSQCFRYLLSLFVERKIPYMLNNKTLECLDKFGKWTNLQYLLQWIDQNSHNISKNQRISFIAKSIDSSIHQILQFVFSTQSSQKINILLSIIQQLHPYLHQLTMQELLQFVQSHRYFNDKVISILLSEHTKGLTLPSITINQTITEQTLIGLLGVDSNLTESPLAVYTSFIEIVKLRMSKVILAVMSLRIYGQSKQGLGRYDKQQIFGIVFGKLQDKISIIDYCLIHGYYDMHKLFCSFYNENYEVADVELQGRPVIPNYRYKTLAVDSQKKSYLMPIANCPKLLNFQHLTQDYLTPAELQVYSSVQEDITNLSVKYRIVQSADELDYMKHQIAKTKLVGIDVEHYSSLNESFICLIQVATIEQVFIIDKFNRINQQVEQFLRELFGDHSKIKIFHSYDNDLKWLCQDYDIPEFHHILDTSRIYTLIEGQKANTPSLKWLASQFLGLDIKKQYQRSDWRIRPLFPQMADYAATDAKVLPYLLLRMLEKGTDLKKGHCLELVRYLESKRIVRSSSKRGFIELL